MATQEEGEAEGWLEQEKGEKERQRAGRSGNRINRMKGLNKVTDGAEQEERMLWDGFKR